MRPCLFFFPLVLTGCQQKFVNSLPSADAFVDQLIQSQLVKIKVEQESLTLASGINFTPLHHQAAQIITSGSEQTIQSKASETIALPPGPRLTPDLAHIRYTGTPQSQPALVTKGGKNQPIKKAIELIVPGGWKVVFSEKLQALPGKTVSWYAGDQWPHSLSKLAGEHDLAVTIYWASNQVIVELASEVEGAGSQNSVPVQPNRALKKMIKHEGELSATDSLQKISETAKKPVPTGLSVQPIPEKWLANTGSTLKDVLIMWAAETECEEKPGQKWTVAWVTETNYRIDAPLEFSGNWREALEQVFRLYQRAAVPLFAGTNSAQCVLKVDDAPMK